MYELMMLDWNDISNCTTMTIFSCRSMDMENRIFDCEICQQACPWNKKHIESPLVTNATTFFQYKISDWEDFFYLPNLAKVTKKEYSETIGPLNTRIPYAIFQRNVLIAMKRVKEACIRIKGIG